MNKLFILSTLHFTLLISGCASAEKYPFDGKIIGASLETTLDSKEALLFAKSNELKYSGNNNSLDIQTIEAVRQIYINNKKLHQTYQKNLHNLSKNADVLRKEFIVLFIPGFMYKSDTTTGADFKKQRELLLKYGVNNKLIEIKENGLVDENARLISNYIEQEAYSHKNIMLVSASKGGLETAIALGKYLKKGAVDKIRAWISIGGIHRGTYLADHAIKFPKSILARIVAWIEGFKFSQIQDMTVSKNEKIFNSLKLPKGIFYLQFIGVPLSGQVSDEIKSRYSELADYGPNDGLTTIKHELVEQGEAIVELGLDHYYRDPNIDKKTLALLITTLNKVTLLQ